MKSVVSILIRLYLYIVSLFDRFNTRLKNNRLFRENIQADKRVPKEKWSVQFFGDLYNHERMLADMSRVNAYTRAIKRHVKPGSTVLDLGTGTGILSFLAAQAGASIVYAIDHSSIIEYARHIARQNGYLNIKFINLHSRDVVIPEKVDIIIQEQMGNYIDAENMINSVVDLRDRVLNDGGRILPNKFEVFIEPIQLKDERRVPFLWEQQIHSIDFSSSHDIGLQNKSKKYLFKDIQSSDVDFLLADPAPFIEFDLETIQINDIPRKFLLRRTINRSSRLDGLCLFWKAKFDEDCFISTHPKSDAFPVSWNNLIYRVKSEQVDVNKELEFNIEIDDLSSIGTWKINRIK